MIFNNGSGGVSKAEFDELNQSLTNNTSTFDVDKKEWLSNILSKTGDTYTVPKNGVIQGYIRAAKAGGVYAIISEKLNAHVYIAHIRTAEDYLPVNINVIKGDVLTATVTEMYASIYFIPYV